MKGNLILARVSHTWNFGEDSYPALETLQDEQALVFSLSHILKHQSKGASWCTAVRKGRILPQLTEIRERLLKMMVNTLRFHTLIQGGEEKVNAVFDWWGCALPSVCDAETLSKIRFGAGFKAALSSFVETTLYANGLLEKPDHGAPLPYSALRGASEELLTETAHMLHMFGVTRKAFEDWLSSPGTLVRLAH